MKQLLNPAFFVAVGFHAILLVLPLSQESKSVEAEPNLIEEVNQSPKLSSSQLVVKEMPELEKKKLEKSRSNKKNTKIVNAQPQIKSQVQQRRVVYSPQKRNPSQARSSEKISKAEPVLGDESKTPEQPIEKVPAMAKNFMPEPIQTAENVAFLNLFYDFPVYPFERSLRGSLELRSAQEDRATYAFNTRDSMEQVIEFYQAEVPKQGFKLLELQTDRADLKIYQVTSNTNNTSQYLHVLLFAGRTAIFLDAEKITEIDPLKEKAREKLAAKRQLISRLTERI